MKKSIFTYFTILFAAIVCLASIYAFNQIEEKQAEDKIEEVDVFISPLVQKYLDEKLERYKQTILKKCKEKAYEAAEVYIDSLVAEELKLLASDTLKFPAKPIRPELREPTILNDSTLITPIIK